MLVRMPQVLWRLSLITIIADIQALTLGSKYIRTSIPLVVDKVYKKLLQYDITARSFAERGSSHDGRVDEYPSKDSSQIQYRKLFLQGYLQKICSDSSKFEFWEYMDKVGMMHCRSTTRRGLHVEYIHLGMAIGFIQDVLFEEILMHSRLKTERKAALVKAIGKVLWIQNDLFARWHLKDGEDTKKPALTPSSEKEGFLHGKMTVNLEAGGSSGAEEGFSSPTLSDIGTPAEELSRCPFTAMTEQMGQLDVQKMHGPS